MRRDRPTVSRSRSERGVTLWLVAFGLIALLGVMALAIDLGILYVARNEAQRAADAAALAGANVFYTEGCTSANGGCYAGGPQESPAANAAVVAAAQDYVAGQPATVSCLEYTQANGTGCRDISFSYPTAPGASFSEEPQITVTVRRTGIQTIFAKIFGATLASVTAVATAEAYSPTGGGSTQTSVECVSPFLVPNCNPNDNTAGTNNSCPPGGGNGYFVNPTTNMVDTSAVGETWTLHFGTSSGDSATPSQWYLDNIWSSSNACTGANSANCLKEAIQQCIPVSCNELLPAVVGKKVGAVDKGVAARIDPTGLGPDTIAPATGSTPPYTITAGAGNPLVAAGDISAGATISALESPSVVTVAVYSGAICSSTVTTDCVGQGSAGGGPTECSGPQAGCVSVVGWMSLFLEGYVHDGSYDGVQAMVLGTSQCGPSNSTSPPVNTSGGTYIPIRLIQQPN